MSNFNLQDQAKPLSYLVKEPKLLSPKTPLLILLHGVGSNEKDLFSFAQQLPEKYLIVSARGPNTIGPDSYAWYEVDFSSGKPVINKQQAEQSRLLLIDFIEALKKKYSFDKKQVYICGFSQGAIMAYGLGLTRPDKVKGIALLSGRLMDEIKPLVRPAAELKDLKVFMSHGTNDAVLGIHYAREGKAYLESLGVHPQYKEYPEGHTISSEMLKDLINWLSD